MPIYAFGCLDNDCCYEAEHFCMMSEQAAWKELLKEEECPDCGQKTIAVFIRGVKIDSKEVRHTAMMRKRFKKRNKQIDDMPPAQKKRMKKFIDKHNIRKTY